MSPIIGVNEPVLLYMLDRSQPDSDGLSREPDLWIESGKTIALIAYGGNERLLRRVESDEEGHLKFCAESPNTRPLYGFEHEILGIALWTGRTLRG